VRNPRTNRFFALEPLVRGAKVLMLSATPINNHRDDLAALFSLFLGSRSRTLTSAELSVCVVRREHHQIEHVRIPAILPTVYHDIPDDPALVEQLMDLPPPVPLRDGGLAAALVGRGLVHLLASSEAALQEALRKRIGRATALCASLEAGTYPTPRDIETWIYSEGTLQLAFAELLSEPVVDRAELLQAVRTHLDALQRIRARPDSQSVADGGRVRAVADIKGSNVGGRTVAFAQYAETISMLFRHLVRTERVAMLTSHGARVAGGSLTRKEAISRFAPLATGSREPAAAERIDLLLTTDLLSEGVNLHDANAVIHLDIPWTAARMEQRVGRVVRLGSPHSQAAVHLVMPPKSALQVLRNGPIVERKWLAAKSVTGTSSLSPIRESLHDAPSKPELSPESLPAKVERLRAILGKWISEVRDGDEWQLRDDGPGSAALGAVEPTFVATLSSSQTVFIAAVSSSEGPQLLVGRHSRVTTDLDALIDVCSRADGEQITSESAETDRALQMICRWVANERASAAAGVGKSSASRRMAITRRIDSLIEDAAPHLRASRLAVTARARQIATTPQCAAVERELDTLLQSDLPAEEWLQAIVDLQPNADRRTVAAVEPVTLHAILHLRFPTAER
jgi:hypothetical protein